MKALILLLGATLCGSVVMGQQPAAPAGSQIVANQPAPAKPPLPSGPLLRRQANYSKWQILYNYPEAKVKANAGGKQKSPSDVHGADLSEMPRSITITRTRPLWHAVTVFLSGNILEQGGDPDCNLVLPGGNGAAFSAPTDADGHLLGFADFSKVDYPDMDWISPQTYVGEQVIAGGISCLVFQNGSVDPITVWVNKETRFPVLWKQGEVTRTFQQLPPPDRPLEFSPGLNKLFQGIKKDLARFKRAVPLGG
jgi:hypothetical protein